MSADKHLNNDQIAGWIAGERDNATEQHLAGCSSCRAKIEGFLGKMTAARELTVLRSARDENYWAAQRMAIAEKLAETPAFRWKSLAFATPVLAAVLGLAMLLPITEQHMSKSGTTQAVNTEISDDELLAAVNDDISRETPQALMAAERFHSERTKILEGTTSTTTSASKRNSQ